MIPTSGRYEAAFYSTDNTGKRYNDHYLPVEAWSDEGEPLVLDEKTGRLRRADSYGNFASVGECQRPRRISAIPGGGWLMRHTEPDGSTWTEPVVGWVIDEYGTAEAIVTDGAGLTELITNVADTPAFIHPDQRNEPATEGATS